MKLKVDSLKTTVKNRKSLRMTKTGKRKGKKKPLYI